VDRAEKRGIAELHAGMRSLEDLRVGDVYSIEGLGYQLLGVLSPAQAIYLVQTLAPIARLGVEREVLAVDLPPLRLARDYRDLQAAWPSGFAVVVSTDLRVLTATVVVRWEEAFLLMCRMFRQTNDARSLTRRTWSRRPRRP
jgi:hypothetical protein